MEEKRESFPRMSSEVPSGSRHLRGAGARNEGDGQITQRRHQLRSRAGAQAGTLFAKGDVAHIRHTILEAPMTPHQIKEASRTGMDGGEVRDEADHPPSVVLPVLCTVTVRVERATWLTSGHVGAR